LIFYILLEGVQQVVARALIVFNLIKKALIQLNTNDPANIYIALRYINVTDGHARYNGVCRLNVIALSGIVPDQTTFLTERAEPDTKTTRYSRGGSFV